LKNLKKRAYYFKARFVIDCGESNEGQEEGSEEEIS
jgi:hypothetical protein